MGQRIWPDLAFGVASGSERPASVATLVGHRAIRPGGSGTFVDDNCQEAKLQEIVNALGRTALQLIRIKGGHVGKVL